MICRQCYSETDVAMGRTECCGAVVGHPVEPYCACGWRLDGARVCPNCGTPTTEREAA